MDDDLAQLDTNLFLRDDPPDLLSLHRKMYCGSLEMKLAAATALPVSTVVVILELRVHLDNQFRRREAWSVDVADHLPNASAAVLVIHTRIDDLHMIAFADIRIAVRPELEDAS